MMDKTVWKDRQQVVPAARPRARPLPSGPDRGASSSQRTAAAARSPWRSPPPRLHSCSKHQLRNEPESKSTLTLSNIQLGPAVTAWQNQPQSSNSSALVPCARMTAQQLRLRKASMSASKRTRQVTPEGAGGAAGDVGAQIRVRALPLDDAVQEPLCLYQLALVDLRRGPNCVAEENVQSFAQQQ